MKLLFLSFVPMWFLVWLVPGDDAGEDAVMRGVKAMEAEVADWNSEQDGCVSCHNALPILIGLHSAAGEGRKVDRSALDDWTNKSVKMEGAIPDESLAFAVLAGVESKITENGIRKYVDMLVKSQREDGSWSKGGQRVLQKRREGRSDVETTMWAILALMRAKAVTDVPAKPVELGLAWIKSKPADDVTERLVVDLLIRSRIQKPGVADIVKILIAGQNEDGGWGWKKDAGSDVIATGQVLFALAESGADVDTETGKRGREFLVSRQKQDGTWTADVAIKGWNQEFVNQSVYWATAWAVLGLVKGI